ncbi:hypothetical protein JCM11641_004589, partial [Rhodosporidiobolus odoratus]
MDPTFSVGPPIVDNDELAGTSVSGTTTSAGGGKAKRKRRKAGEIAAAGEELLSKAEAAKIALTEAAHSNQDGDAYLAQLGILAREDAVARARAHSKNSTTNSIYNNKLKRYINYFKDTGNEYAGKISPYPITPVKAYLFLIWYQDEPSEQTKGKLGRTSLQQMVSSLEKERRDTVHRFPAVPNVKLRDDASIRQLEDLWKKDEAKRSEQGMSSKAQGSLQERITTDQQLNVFDQIFTSARPSAVSTAATDIRN